MVTFDELPMKMPEPAPRTQDKALLGGPDTGMITGGIGQ
jgi:hypothetical protein